MRVNNPGCVGDSLLTQLEMVFGSESIFLAKKTNCK